MEQDIWDLLQKLGQIGPSEELIKAFVESSLISQILGVILAIVLLLGIYRFFNGVYHIFTAKNDSERAKAIDSVLWGLVLVASSFVGFRIGIRVMEKVVDLLRRGADKLVGER